MGKVYTKAAAWRNRGLSVRQIQSLLYAIKTIMDPVEAGVHFGPQFRLFMFDMGDEAFDAGQSRPLLFLLRANFLQISTNTAKKFQDYVFGLVAHRQNVAFKDLKVN